ncbi:cytochrome P450 [Sedimentibacter sp.]|uniref:cytochrome P450 n=1 Tax=Sedimentibacter sp. TaxID=1960295 RepID=UPI0028AC2534|nr:cytochrome P450 [Sedimentibacter sp.]
MPVKEHIKNEESLDSTIALATEGYLFIKNKIDQNQTDAFETRLFGKKVICMSGEEAAKMFYNAELFQRNGAMPKRIQRTLVGEEAIQTLDGEEHIRRKQQFMSLLKPVNIKYLVNIFNNNLDNYINRWENSERVVLFEEMNEILCKTACQWSGVPLSESEIKERADNFSEMVDAFGAVGPRHWKGRIARNKAENWINSIIKDVRSNKLHVEENTALYSFAYYKDINGKQLSDNLAAIELINVLRPIIAISTYITFTALALYDNPKYLEKLLVGDSNYYKMFIKEVKRYYPFGPFLGAKVRKDFKWNNIEFEKGMLVILDIYGTNHDSKLWAKPFDFWPERFDKKKDELFNFIPHGGGDASNGHRCPGEGVTTEIMKASLDLLVNKIEYEVPKQDVSFSLTKMPTLPESGFIMNKIKRKF